METWLEARARRNGSAPALRDGARRWTFEHLWNRAQRRRSGLRHAGVRFGDTVALLLPTGGDFVELVHGIDALGGTVLPLHLRLTAEELAFQLGDARPALLVHGDGELARRAQSLARKTGIPCTGASSLDREPVAVPDPHSVDPERPFALLYTSGTTGRPKGALLSRRAFHASARASAALLAPVANACALACLPLYHVGGLSLVARNVLHGTPLSLHDRFDPRRVNAAIDDEGIATVSLVPTMLERVLDDRADRPAPDTLRTALLGGAAAPESLMDRAAAAGFPISPTYGLTEACSQVATRPPHRSGGLEPLPGSTVRIRDDGGTPVSPGVAGEITLRGPTLFSGYHQRPEETARAFRDGWLHTGDIGALDEHGRLQVFDRRSDLIVSGGENIYPAEIERVLLEHPEVVDAGVAGVPDPEYGARPAAWVVLRSEGPIDLVRFCRDRLAPYKVPGSIRTVAELPRNALGKLRRGALGALDAAVTPQPTPHAAPSSPEPPLR